MQKSDRTLIWLFTAVMLAFCLFLVWFIPTRASLDFSLSDIDKSLETSYGRERKQQAEYDAVTTELPRVRAELEAIQPQADAAAADVAALKEARKTLRAEKAELESLLESQSAAEESPVPGESEGGSGT